MAACAPQLAAAERAAPGAGQTEARAGAGETPADESSPDLAAFAAEWRSG